MLPEDAAFDHFSYSKMHHCSLAIDPTLLKKCIGACQKVKQPLPWKGKPLVLKPSEVIWATVGSIELNAIRRMNTILCEE